MTARSGRPAWECQPIRTRGRRYVRAFHRDGIILQRYQMELFYAFTTERCSSHILSCDHDSESNVVESMGTQLVRASSYVRVTPLKSTIWQVAKCRMLEDVVPIPFHTTQSNCCLQHPETVNPTFAGFAQRCNRRGFLKVTLQVSIGPKFAKLFRHYSRISTERSPPGMLRPTDKTDSVYFCPRP